MVESGYAKNSHRVSSGNILSPFTMYVFQTIMRLIHKILHQIPRFLLESHSRTTLSKAPLSLCHSMEPGDVANGSLFRPVLVDRHAFSVIVAAFS